MDDPTTDDWLEAFGQLSYGFWMCPRGHSEHGWSAASRDSHWAGGGATVQWVGNVAHCLKPDCDETSAP